MVCQQAILLLLGALVSSANGRDFLGATRKVSSAAAQAELNGVLGEVLGHAHGVAGARLSKIHKTVDPLFRSLPKNKQGHISAHVMRYAVRRYFSQTHGWIVKGFNAYEEDVNVSAAADTAILQNKLPGYIRSILEDRFALEGFSLDAVVAMVASLERLAFDEVVRGVELAFYLNDYDRTGALSESDLTEILSSFLITEMLEGTDDKEAHRRMRKKIHRRYPHWDTTLLFLKDNVGSDIFERRASLNPFAEQTYSFEDAVRMAERVSEDFGSWSNHECHEMKDMLMEMDVHDTGRVKLSDFYSYSKDGAWQFLEPSEQLRQLGALDESSTWLGPQVMISNYITSMSNCITSAPYYSICCLNECDQVFQQLESRIAAPSATASQIVKALESSTGGPNISALHQQRLNEIASLHSDQIHLHGRLFARWLHFVFPQECPYPHAAGVVKPFNQREWKELVGEEAESASDEEIIGHLQTDFAKRAPSVAAGAEMWSLDESLMESSTPSDFRPNTIRTSLRIATQIGMLVALLSLLKPLMLMLRSGSKQKAIEYDV